MQAPLPRQPHQVDEARHSWASRDLSTTPNYKENHSLRSAYFSLHILDPHFSKLPPSTSNSSLCLPIFVGCGKLFKVCPCICHSSAQNSPVKHKIHWVYPDFAHSLFELDDCCLAKQFVCKTLEDETSSKIHFIPLVIPYWMPTHSLIYMS